MRDLIRRFHLRRLKRTGGAAICVRAGTRFALNELRGVAGERTYRLRGSEWAVQVRHPLLDMWVLEELFRHRVYEPPPEARHALDTLSRPLKVVDVGGHVGYFGIFVRDLFADVQVVSFEPDPGNSRQLERCIAVNGLEGSWELIRACAATEDGSVEFESSYHLSRAARTPDTALHDLHDELGAAIPFLQGSDLLRAAKPTTVPCRDAFPRLVEADLVKIDAEGAEWTLLADPRFRAIPAPAVVIEFHPDYTTDADPEALARRLLGEAGYRTGPVSWGGQAGLMWAWRIQTPGWEATTRPP